MQHSTRRQFVTLAGAAALGTVGRTIVTAKDEDFVLKHLDHDITRLVHRAHQQQATDGDVSVLAAHLRLLADHPAVAALSVRHVTLDDIAQVNLEQHRRQLERKHGVPVPALVLPDFSVQDRLLTTLQQNVPQALRNWASMIDHRPRNLILPASYVTRPVQDLHGYGCGWFRTIGYGLTFTGIIFSMSGAGVVVGGIVAGTGLFFSMVVGYGC